MHNKIVKTASAASDLKEKAMDKILDMDRFWIVFSIGAVIIVGFLIFIVSE